MPRDLQVSPAQLYRALDRKHIKANVFEELSEETIQLGKMMGALMSYLQQSDFKGSKFHEPDSLYNGLSEN